MPKGGNNYGYGSEGHTVTGSGTNDQVWGMDDPFSLSSIDFGTLQTLT